MLGNPAVADGNEFANVNGTLGEDDQRPLVRCVLSRRSHAGMWMQRHHGLLFRRLSVVDFCR